MFESDLFLIEKGCNKYEYIEVCMCKEQQNLCFRIFTLALDTSQSWIFWTSNENYSGQL